jgi:hypothetical protein
LPAEKASDDKTGSVISVAFHLPAGRRQHLAGPYEKVRLSLLRLLRIFSF